MHATTSRFRLVLIFLAFVFEPSFAIAAEPADLTLADGRILRAAVVTELTQTHAIVRYQNEEHRLPLDLVPLDALGRARLEQDARLAAEPKLPPESKTLPEKLSESLDPRLLIGGGTVILGLLVVVVWLSSDRRTRAAGAKEIQAKLDALTQRYAPISDISREIARSVAQLEEAEAAKKSLLSAMSALRAEEAGLRDQTNRYRIDLECYDQGLYEPVFDFDISQKYKDAIEAVREAQKSMLKDETAAKCAANWTVNGSLSEGRKQTKHYMRLMLRAFNGETDAIIANIKWNNVDRMIERLEKSFDGINKLGDTHGTSISREYWQLKLKELRLVHEHAEKIQAEKEEQRRISEQIREEERAQREIDQALKEAEDDERKYQRALERAREDLSTAQGEQVGRMERQISVLEERLHEAEANKQRAISRAQITKSGHVYIISNIGSLGEGIFKIGMTRRLEPLDRVRELGDASVPFEFDVHAMVYTDDAPALESLMHEKFGTRRVNLVNDRKEFFAVTIEEIESALTAHGYKMDVIKIPEAKAFRQSSALRHHSSAPFSAVRQTKDDHSAGAYPLGTATG